jgi:hypothetical protein
MRKNKLPKKCYPTFQREINSMNPTLKVLLSNANKKI